MAEERVDALVLTTRFDEQSLDASAQQQLAGIRRFTTQAQQLGRLPPLDLDTGKFRASLGSASQSVQDFFAGFTGAKVGDVVGLLQGINTELAATGRSGFLQSLIPALEAIRGEFAATSTEARELQSILTALGAPVALNVQPAVSASDTLIARLGLTTRAATTAREALSQPIQLRILTSGEVGTLSGQLQSLRATEVAVEGATRRMNAAFAESGRAARVASAGSEAWARGMANLRAQTEGTNAAFLTSGAGASRLRGGLTALAVSASGVSPAIGQVVSGLLLLGAGSTVVLGVAAGIAVIATVLNGLGETERRLREDHERLVASFRQRITAGDETGPAAERAAADKLRAEAPRQIAELEATIARNRLLGLNTLGQEVALAGARRALAEAHVLILRDQDRLEADKLEKERQQLVLLQAINALAQSNVDVLARGLAGGITAPNTQADAAATQTLLAQQLRERTGTQAELNAKLAQYIQLQEGSLKATEQRFALEQRTAQTALGNFQRLQSQAELLGAPVQLRVDAEKAKAGLDTVERALLRNAAAADQLAIAADKALPGTEAANRLRQEAEAFRTLAASIESAVGPTQRLLQAQQQLRIEQAAGGNRPQGVGAPPIRVEIIQPTIAPTGADQLPAILQGIAQSGVTRDLQAGLDRDLQAATRLNASFQSMARGLAEVGSAAASIGLIGEFARQALVDVGGLIGGLGQIREAAAAQAAARKITDPAQQASALANASIEKFSGVVSVVSAGLGLVGNLLSIGSALDAEHNALVSENSRHLADLSLSLDRSFQGAGGLERGAAITGQVTAAVDTLLRAGGFSFLRTQETFETALAQSGLSVSEFGRLVKQTTGIDVLDSKGRLVAATLGQANDAFRAVIQQITQFGASLADQQRVLETRDLLGLGPNAGQPQDLASLNRTREIELQGLQLDPATEARIASLNLATEAGRKAFLAFNQMLFTLAQNGQLTAEQLGTFASVTELLGPINDAANGINKLADATGAATAAMINVPAGFKQAQLAFEAQIPGLGPNAVQPTPLRPQPFEPRVPGLSVTTAPSAAKTTMSTSISVGVVNIRLDATGKDGPALARDIRDNLRNIAGADSGDFDQWGAT